MIGYKIAKSCGEPPVRVLITLEIPPDAQTNLDRKSVVSRETASYRADRVQVVKIEDSDGNEYDQDVTDTGIVPFELTYKKGNFSWMKRILKTSRK